MTYLPLEGIKVLDLTRLVPGALCTRRLADLGADVLKIEEPLRGDSTRTMPPEANGMGVMHWCFNRNKQSLALDLKTSEGRRLFDELVNIADVLVEVSVPGSFQRMGLDFDAMRRRRPELVVCSISGFGQTGDFSKLPSHGMNMDALSACLSTRQDDGRKVIDFSIGTSIASELGAANATIAILAAVLNARATGQGASIDISCWDAAVEIHRLSMCKQSVPGMSSASAAEGAVLYAIYEAADGRDIVFCAMEQRFWQRFCEGVDRLDLVSRWQGAPGAAVDYRAGDEELRAELASIFKRENADIWDTRFIEWGVPGCRILHPDDLYVSDHFRQRGLAEIGTGPMATILDPIRWGDGSRPGTGAAPPPSLGEHGEEAIHRWLGRTDN